ncbi:MFS general substrate transporter [Melanogaster broomeanus]|nr:MFS general substrate transporter [Melanogaster broomeanus]
MLSALKTASHTPRGQLDSAHSTKGRLDCTVAPTLTAEQEAKLWRKIDLRIIPVISLMFLFTFTDRAAIGFAAINGLMTQLDLTGNKFNIILSLCVFEVPGKCLGFVKSYHQLLALRVCLGAIEGAFSGFIGFAMGGMNGVGGLEAWSWIFDVEDSVKIFDGIGTVIAGIIAIFFMVDHPSTAEFLTEEERLIVIEQIGSGAAPENNEHGAVQQIWAAFTDWQVMGIVCCSLLDLVTCFGYSTAITQVLTIPLYLLSTAILLVLGYYSDKAQLRSPFIFAGQFMTLVGFIIYISDAPFGAKYFGLVLCLMGNSSGSGAICWLANNLGGRYKRATGMALQFTVSNVGGAIASIIFRSQDAPRYIYGNSFVYIDRHTYYINPSCVEDRDPVLSFPL